MLRGQRINYKSIKESNADGSRNPVAWYQGTNSYLNSTEKYMGNKESSIHGSKNQVFMDQRNQVFMDQREQIFSCFMVRDIGFLESKN